MTAQELIDALLALPDGDKSLPVIGADGEICRVIGRNGGKDIHVTAEDFPPMPML